ncbi:MAG: hypothetical protein MRJ93_00160 [Nitrososphaeraceae archaeon]|nr:hypothetical protein [Nitrososphaeraceae archaeon]
MRKNMINLGGFKKTVFLSVLPLISLGVVSYGLEIDAQTESPPVKNSTNSNSQNQVTFLEIRDLTIERSPTNLLEVKGNVYNNSTSELHDIKLTMKFFDKEGSPLVKNEYFITAPSYVMKTDDQLSFDKLEVVNFQKLGDSEIIATGKPIS